MEKKNSKKWFVYIPEALLLVGGLLLLLADLIYGSSTPLISGLVVLGILAVSALLIWKNRYLALALSIVAGCIGIFFLLGLLSEFSEFPAGNREGLRMLLTGILLFGGLLAVSIVMPKKYFSRT